MNAENPERRSVASGGGSLVGADDVLAAEPVIRRVVAARVRDREAVDDLVQDALERLLRARDRIDGCLLIPYAVVTARNLVASHARRGGREEPRSDIEASVLPDGPGDSVVAAEDRQAMVAALARLPAQERSWLIAHEADGVAIADLGAGGVSPATMRVRLARARARLRVEYVLNTAGVELPTVRCYPALLSLAGGEQARRVAAARHLLGCETCAGLSEDLVARRRRLDVVVPVLLWRWVSGPFRAHPAVSAASGAVAAAAAAAALVTAVAVASAGGARSGSSHPGDGVASASRTVPVTVAAGLPSTEAVGVPGLSVDGRPLTAVDGSLRSWTGRLVAARGVVVQSVVTHDGFWVGPSPEHRVFVEMVGPLRALQVRAGQTVTFTAPLVAQAADYAAEAGVTPAEGAAQLNSEGTHLAVVTTQLSIGP